MNETSVPVSITQWASNAWTPTTYGVWALVIMQAFLLAGVIVKKGPEWITAWIASRKQEAEEEREARVEKSKSELALGERLSAVEDRLSRMGQALTFVMNAATMSNAALEAAEPNHPSLRQSRELIALAASALGGEDPFSKALSQLATVRGVGE